MTMIFPSDGWLLQIADDPIAWFAHAPATEHHCDIAGQVRTYIGGIEVRTPWRLEERQHGRIISVASTVEIESNGRVHCVEAQLGPGGWWFAMPPDLPTGSYFIRTPPVTLGDMATCETERPWRDPEIDS